MFRTSYVLACVWLSSVATTAFQSILFPVQPLQRGRFLYICSSTAVSYRSVADDLVTIPLSQERSIAGDIVSRMVENKFDRQLDSPEDISRKLRLHLYLQPETAGGVFCEEEARAIEVWKSINKRGSLKHFDGIDHDKVREAIKVHLLSDVNGCKSRLWSDLKRHLTGIVAILGEMKAPVDVVLAAILCEPLQQHYNDLSKEQLDQRFGVESVQLAMEYLFLPSFSVVAGGVLSPQQAQSRLEMLVAMMPNYYCLHIRLAEQLHHLRSLEFLRLDDTQRNDLAQQARHVYAPLAHKMNLMTVKHELEDLSFKYLEPQMYSLCRDAQVIAKGSIVHIQNQLRQLIDHDPELVEIKEHIKLYHRIKSKYQLFSKMRHKGLQRPDEVLDMLGLRVVINVPHAKGEGIHAYQQRSQEWCYRLLQRIRDHPMWESLEDGFKDYIQHPKENGYRSIHQYVRRRSDHIIVDVQIRTKEMHLQAEVGTAAHWSYKDQIYRPDVATSELYRSIWRSDAQLSATQAMEVIRISQKLLNQHRTFVFAENTSHVLNLKRPATALDAAFAISEGAGLTAESIYLDGQWVAKNTPLQDGQIVSVKTSGSVPVPEQVETASQCVHSQCEKSVIRRNLRDQRSQTNSSGFR